MNAADTNVLIYSLDSSDPTKHAKAKSLLARLVGGADYDGVKIVNPFA